MPQPNHDRAVSRAGSVLPAAAAYGQDGPQQPTEAAAPPPKPAGAGTAPTAAWSFATTAEREHIYKVEQDLCRQSYRVALFVFVVAVALAFIGFQAFLRDRVSEAYAEVEAPRRGVYMAGTYDRVADEAERAQARQAVAMQVHRAHTPHYLLFAVAALAAYAGLRWHYHTRLRRAYIQCHSALEVRRVRCLGKKQYVSHRPHILPSEHSLYLELQPGAEPTKTKVDSFICKSIHIGDEVLLARRPGEGTPLYYPAPEHADNPGAAPVQGP